MTITTEEFTKKLLDEIADRRKRQGGGETLLTSAGLEAIIRKAMTPEPVVTGYPRWLHKNGEESVMVHSEEHEKQLGKGWSSTKDNGFEQGYPRWVEVHLPGQGDPSPHTFWNPADPSEPTKQAYATRNRSENEYTAQELLAMGWQPTKYLVHSEEEKFPSLTAENRCQTEEG